MLLGLTQAILSFSPTTLLRAWNEKNIFALSVTELSSCEIGFHQLPALNRAMTRVQKKSRSPSQQQFWIRPALATRIITFLKEA